MIKKNAPILVKGTQNYFSLYLIYTLFLISIKWSTGSVKLKRREYLTEESDGRGPISLDLFVLYMDKLSHIIFVEVSPSRMNCVTAIMDQFGHLSQKQVSQEKTNIVFPKNMK